MSSHRHFSAVSGRLFAGLIAVVTASGLAAASEASAQTPPQNPTPQQVQQARDALQNRPGVGSMVRSRIASSGLTPAQVRDRLQAAGYPAGMLDAYLPGSAAGAPAPEPGDDVMRAVSFLGLVDSTEAAATGRGASEVTRVPGPPVTPEKPETVIFGLDVFRRSTSQFQPDLAGPVDPSYRVGPRDVLALIMTGGVENSYSLEVTREGFVVIPQVGQVFVANMNLDQVEDALFARLKRAYSGMGRDATASTRFYVTVAKLRTNQVFVIGEASAPASYQVSSVGTMLTALYGAGGPSENGTMRRIELRRRNRTVSTLDVYDYLIRGDASRDARLESGDVIFVPVHGPRVRVNGAVVRPATYELAAGETLQDLLRMAGGFRAEAGRRRVLVRRVLPPAQRTGAGGRDRTVLDVSSPELTSGTGPAFALADGDEVDVFTISGRVRNSISVGGAVWQPGAQGFTPGMRLSDAVRLAGGVRPDVKDALISRLTSDQQRVQLRAEFADSVGTPVTDIALQEDDAIEVFATSDFRPERYVAITGAVNKGGRYPWREGMTLRDLVHLAGGMADGAYLVTAEVARLPEKREMGILASTMRVPLDSTYLLERTLDGRYNGPRGISVGVGTAAPFAVQPYDNVLIFRQPDWELDRTVTITGEVAFPGTYTLLSKDERLSSVIARAGGMTPRAYEAATKFVRSRGGIGRIAVDVGSALRKAGSREDVALVPGDAIQIPPFEATVKIEGSVQAPIALSYVPGKKLTFYVDGAGGATFAADLRRAYVQQPSGMVEPYRRHLFGLIRRNPTPLAGSVVVVPAKDPNEKKDWTSIAGSIAQIIASTVAIVAVTTR